MLTWFSVTIVEILWYCVTKLSARFPRIKFYGDGFDFSSSVLSVQVLPILWARSTFSSWNGRFISSQHSFTRCKTLSFLSSLLHSVPWILRQLSLLYCSLSSHLDGNLPLKLINFSILFIKFFLKFGNYFLFQLFKHVF